MALSTNQSQVSTEIGATVTLLQQALDQCKKVQGDLQRLGATALSADVAASIGPLGDALGVLSKDLSVVNDLGNVT